MKTLPVVDDSSGIWFQPVRVFISPTPIAPGNPTTQIYNGKQNDGEFYRVAVPDNFDLAQYVRFQSEMSEIVLCEGKVFVKGI